MNAASKPCPLRATTPPARQSSKARTAKTIYRHSSPDRCIYPCKSVAELSLGMRFVVDVDQLLHRDVCINLRGGQARVAQQLLNVAQVCAAVEQVRRKRMSQCMRADVVHPGAEPDVLL